MTPRTRRAGGAGAGAPLLATKLYIPRARPDLVARPRLLARLEAGVRGPLTLVAAPAGAGKTTLLSAWHAAHPARPLAWLSLDSADNDPARFWAYVLAALGTFGADLVDHTAALLATPRPPPIESVLAVLINELVALPDDAVLVLDDYHVIATPAISSALAYLLDHLPPALHIVLVSRSDPALPLARLRARGQLTEIRLADLRFTDDEAATFLSDVMGLHLPAATVADLARETEGWAAGLQLAALSLQGRAGGDVAGPFGGADRYVVDYLVDEVLAGQPAAVQAFLLQTSILDRFCAPLCDAVTGQVGGQATLEHLERANLFLVPLDAVREWYRYHHLFAEVLRARLQRAAPETLADLHRRAGAWYAAQGLTAEAVDHVLAAADLARAAELVEAAAPTLLMRSQLATLRGWIERLPEDLLRRRPRLLVALAWPLLLAGDVEGAERRLAQVATAAEAPDRAVLGEIAALRAISTMLRGDLLGAGRAGKQALTLLPRDSFLRSLVALNLGVPPILRGDIVAAARGFALAARIAGETGNILVALIALCQVAELQIVLGRTHEAMSTYQQAQDLATERDGRPLPVAGMAYMGVGELLREWNDLAGATRFLVEGLALRGQWGDLSSFDGLLSLARVRQAQGDPAGARAAFESAVLLAQGIGGVILRVVEAQQARVWLRQGDLAAALRWAETCGLPVDAELGYVDEPAGFTLARVLAADGRTVAAAALLARLLPPAAAGGRVRSVIEGKLLQALIAAAGGATAPALALLTEALVLAEPGGFVRLFLDEGPPLVALLGQLRAAQPGPPPLAPGLVAYLDRLLAMAAGQLPRAHPAPAPVPAPAGVGMPAAGLVEPLRPQELEVLRLIAAGRSNPEIAAALVIALSTVKWHINNLYGKLDVRTRTQAVARARALHLL